ncbi:MAG: serine protease [Solirubrobacterales bacterium]|nr:serine protease [Solirubrobacterales bacterium]
MMLKPAKLLLATIAASALAGAPAAAAASPSELPANAAHVPGQLLVELRGDGPQELSLPHGVDLTQAAGALRQNPRVRYAVPNYIATASTACPAPSFPPCPNDPGSSTGAPGDWTTRQWNFLDTAGVGVDAPSAWQHLIDRGKPGATGIKVGVVDSGVAYRNLGKRYARSPDFGSHQFTPGYDFVDNDNHPFDLFGHGTHIAGTIAERIDNGRALTGLAYNARIMPVRVLDRNGKGTASQVAKGIRFAVDHHARIVNLSFNFPASLGRHQLPAIYQELKRARSHGSIVVAAAGNSSSSSIPYPAAGPGVIAVGATTENGCLAKYSNRGSGIDVAAPGGGVDDPLCPAPAIDNHRSIAQLTLNFAYRNYRHFAIAGLQGTSQAAGHVSGTAALVIASRLLGSHPTAGAILQRLRAPATSTPLPAPFQAIRLINAGSATDPLIP